VFSDQLRTGAFFGEVSTYSGASKNDRSAEYQVMQSELSMTVFQEILNMDTAWSRTPVR
jgi:hypothetical protein